MAENTSIIGSAPTQAIQTDFGDIMNQSLSRADTLRREKKAEDEVLRKEKLAQTEKFRDTYGFDEDLMVLQDSEFRTLNDATTQTMHKLRDRYYDVFKQLEQTPNDLEGKKRLGKITSSIKNIRQSYEKMQLMGEDYKKKLAEGKLSGVHEKKWQEILEATDQGTLNIQLDKNDNLQFMFYDKPDKDGNATLGKVMSYKELIQGSLYDKVDIAENIDGIVKSFGENITASIEGGFAVTESELGETNKEIASDMIMGQLEDDAVMADILNQMEGSMQETDFTDEQRLKVHDEMMKRVEARFGKKVQKQQLRDDRTSADKTKISYEDNIGLAKDSVTGQPVTVDGSVGFVLQQGVQLDAADKYAKVDEVFINPSSGALSYRGQQKRKVEAENLSAQDKADLKDAGYEGKFPDQIEDKTEQQQAIEAIQAIFADTPRLQTETVFVSLSGKDAMAAGKIAKRLGFKDAIEMKDFLKSKLPTNGNKPKAY
jgi:hypothetical protein